MSLDIESLHQLFIRGLVSDSPGQEFRITTNQELDECIFLHSTIVFSKDENSKIQKSTDNSSVSSSTRNLYVHNEPTIQIYIRRLTMPVVTIDANENDRIIQIKQKILDKEAITIKSQILNKNGKNLLDDKTLVYYGISHNDTINLTIRIKNNDCIKISSVGRPIIKIVVNEGETVINIKKKVEQSQNIKVGDQRLLFKGKEMIDTFIIEDLHIQNNDQFQLEVLNGSKYSKIFIDPSQFSPSYNFDFTSIIDNPRDAYRKGGHIYYRPCGWRRIALNVLGRYENSVWLGSTNAAGEWSVAYHGTKMIDSSLVAKYNLSLSNSTYYGSGIYCSTKIETIVPFCSKYRDPLTGIQYYVVIQSRTDYDHMIPINQNGKPCDLYMVEQEQFIRCYSICLLQQ